MKFTQTGVHGACEVDLEYRGDDRGFFARVFCREEFIANGLDPEVAQVNNSMSREAGTLRGLHYQVAPHGEAKLLRCLHGAVFDVVLDLRAGSPTFGSWHGATLTAENRKMLFVPKGCAHGFLTLKPDTEVLYLASSPYAGAMERIVRWDDPKFAINWPIAPVVLSEKDANALDYDPDLHGFAG